MVCSACGRQVDPDRSFCVSCGCMVFVDEGERRSRIVDDIARQTSQIDNGAVTPTALPQAPRSTTVQPRVQPRIPRPPSPSGLGCTGCLVRLVLFAIVIWFAGKWLLTIPEVRTLVSSFLSGSFSDDQVTAAINAVRANILQLLGGTTSSR